MHRDFATPPDTQAQKEDKPRSNSTSQSIFLCRDGLPPICLSTKVVQSAAEKEKGKKRRKIIGAHVALSDTRDALSASWRNKLSGREYAVKKEKIRRKNIRGFDARPPLPPFSSPPFPRLL